MTDQAKPKTSLRNVLSSLLFAVLLALLILYIVSKRETLADLLRLSPATVTGMLLCALGMALVNCFYHKFLLDTYHLELKTVDWLGLVSVANALSYVLPLRGDLVFSAAYYKRTHGFAYHHSVSIAAGNVVFGVLFSLLQMGVSLVMMAIRGGTFPALLWIGFAIGCLLVGALIVLSLFCADHMPARLARIPYLTKTAQGFSALVRNRGLLLKLLVCQILSNVLSLLLYVACFRSIGIAVGMDQVLIYNAVSRVISLVAIVPGNIGIAQVLMGAAGAALGDLFDNGVMASLLQSASLLIVYIALGLLFAYPVWKRWHSAQAPSKTKGGLER